MNQSRQPSKRPANQKPRGKKKAAKWVSVGILIFLLIGIGGVLGLVINWYQKITSGIPGIVDRGSSVIVTNPSNVDTNVSGPGDDFNGIDDIPSNPEPTPIYKRDPIDPNVVNILLLGRDVDTKSKERGRTDTMMMLSYNKSTGKTYLTSFMRDTLVQIEKSHNRLNAAHQIGGPGLTINTINDTYNLDIQRYVIVNLDGFKKIVELLDGVTVDVTEKEATRLNQDYNVKLKSGSQKLTPEQAFWFVRIRKNAGDDWGRTDRQRRFIAAVLKESLSSSPAELVELINAGTDYVQTNLKMGEVKDLIKSFKSLSNGTVDSAVVPVENAWQYGEYNGMSIILIDINKNRNAIRDRIYG